MKWIVKIANEEFFKKGVVYGREIKVSNMGVKRIISKENCAYILKTG